MKLILELFAGYGSQSLALKRLGVNHISHISEIDKYAIDTYNQIHGKTPNYGDICKINTDNLPKYYMITYSFPCQDISNAGKQKGFSKDSGTRSSLLWECERIIRAVKPKYLLMENVKAIVNKKNMPDYLEWLKTLEELGYVNYWQVLNAKDYGVPQNRERVFCVSIRKDVEQGYKFPEKIPLERKLKDILEPVVEERYYLSQEQVDRFLQQGNTNPSGRGMNGQVCTSDISSTLTTNKGEGAKILELGNCKEKPYLIGNIYGENKGTGFAGNVWDENGISPTLTTMQGGGRQPMITVKANTKQGYEYLSDGDSLNLEQPNSETRRGRVGHQVAQTLTCSCNQAVYNTRIRKLTPRECWRLMGVDDTDFDKIQGISKTQLYKMAGNSIVVDVLVAIFRELFND